MDQTESHKGKSFVKVVTVSAGFKDYGTSSNAPPRESMELRSYCFWEDAEPKEPAMEL